MILLNKCCKCVLRKYGGLQNSLSGKSSLFRRNASTAGVIIIGDEILKGQVGDTNTYFFAQQLYKRGYQLKKVITLPDDITIISETMRAFSSAYNIVLTSGGIGPTHDDVTYEALAKAFNDTLYYNPKIVEMCKTFFKTDDDNHPVFKLAQIPLSSKLAFGLDKVTGKKAFYPNVSLNNVFIFPGVPHMCRRMFNINKDELFPIVGKYFNSRVYIDANESDVTSVLNEAVFKFKNITFGSYPIFFHGYYSVKITLESINEQEVFDGVQFLNSKISSIIDYDDNCFENKLTKIKSLNNNKLNSLINNFEELLKSTNIDNIYLYLDGGKNSILLLHVLSGIVEDKKINVIHVESKVTSYVENFVKNYYCNFIKFNENNFKRFLKIDNNMILIKGMRKSDPKFDEIFTYFNNFNFYNPIENWDYYDVWDIVRKLSLPYCDLYDKGFSSLNGPINNDLITKGPRSDLIYYKRAHLLQDKSLE